jgi:HPt (histidine-containing phosphotransfer) domain-containing protein
MNDADYVDLEQLLHRLLNDQDLAVQVCTLFVDDVEKKISGLSEKLAEGDLEQLGRIAHSMKGAAANLSAEPMRSLAEKIEQAAHSKDLAIINDLLPDFRKVISKTVQAVQVVINGEHWQ